MVEWGGGSAATTACQCRIACPSYNHPHPFASTPLLLADSDADGTDSWQSLIHDGAVLEMVGSESVRGLPLDAINQLLEGCGRPARLQVGN